MLQSKVVMKMYQKSCSSASHLYFSKINEAYSALPLSLSASPATTPLPTSSREEQAIMQNKTKIKLKPDKATFSGRSHVWYFCLIISRKVWPLGCHQGWSCQANITGNYCADNRWILQVFETQLISSRFIFFFQLLNWNRALVVLCQAPFLLLQVSEGCPVAEMRDFVVLLTHIATVPCSKASFHTALQSRQAYRKCSMRSDCR